MNDSSDDYLMEATTLQMVGKTAEALELVKTALEKFPDEGDLWLAKWEFLYDSDRTEEAIQAIIEGIRRSPSYELQMALAETMMKEERYDVAKSALEDALTYRPTSPKALKFKDEVNRKLG